ncbi:MAG TPA: hypothetical protein VHJ18_04925 [Streptosporangiaceae bacterium]|nr:hypothetical protein [Streptosporangiaceae bacterium]
MRLYLRWGIVVRGKFFLQGQGQAENEAARRAVEQLAEHCTRVTEKQFSAESLELLHFSIMALLSEIEALDGRFTNTDRVKHLKATAERIGVQMTAACAAISASAGAVGSELNSRVILAGLAGCVASEVVAALHDWRTQANQRSGMSDLSWLKILDSRWR